MIALSVGLPKPTFIVMHTVFILVIIVQVAVGQQWFCSQITKPLLPLSIVGPFLWEWSVVRLVTACALKKFNTKTQMGAVKKI